MAKALLVIDYSKDFVADDGALTLVASLLKQLINVLQNCVNSFYKIKIG